MTNLPPQTNTVNLPPPEETNARGKISQFRANRAEKRAERMEHKDALYAYLGDVASSYVRGEETDTKRVAPRTRVERFMAKRINKQLDRLASTRAARARREKGGGGGQTYGIRPAVSQFKRHRKAGRRYRAGEISEQELGTEKLLINASRKKVSVRDIDQRVGARRGAEARFAVEDPAKQYYLPIWRGLRRKHAEKVQGKHLERVRKRQARLAQLAE